MIAMMMMMTSYRKSGLILNIPSVLLSLICVFVPYLDAVENIHGNIYPEQLKVVKTGERDAMTRLYGEIVKPILETKLDDTASQNQLNSYKIQSNESFVDADIPRYIVHPPPILYTSKWQPAVIFCVAEPAILIYTICVTSLSHHLPRYQTPELNGSSLSYLQTRSRTNHGLDQITTNQIVPGQEMYQNQSRLKHQPKNLMQSSKIGRRQSTRMIINARMVEEWFGDFWCHCEAWNNVLKLGEPRVTISNRTYVQLAYIDKRFLKRPESSRIPLGWRVEFTCIPPDGRPFPKVYWTKNGQPIDFDSYNGRVTTFESISNESSNINSTDAKQEVVNKESADSGILTTGHLILKSTELADEGNYSCIAENQAGRRVSEIAQLTIHADGCWSSWSQWTNCPIECIKTPIDHAVDVTLDSSSNSTSSSNVCPTRCRDYQGRRSRQCNSPAPHGGGRHCLGPGEEQRSCYEICQENRTISEFKTVSDDTIRYVEVALFLCLSLTLLFFLVASACLLYLSIPKWCPIIIRLIPRKFAIKQSPSKLPHLSYQSSKVYSDHNSEQHFAPNPNFVSNEKHFDLSNYSGSLELNENPMDLKPNMLNNQLQDTQSYVGTPQLYIPIVDLGRDLQCGSNQNGNKHNPKPEPSPRALSRTNPRRPVIISLGSVHARTLPKSSKYVSPSNHQNLTHSQSMQLPTYIQNLPNPESTKALQISIRTRTHTTDKMAYSSHQNPHAYALLNKYSEISYCPNPSSLSSSRHPPSMHLRSSPLPHSVNPTNHPLNYPSQRIPLISTPGSSSTDQPQQQQPPCNASKLRPKSLIMGTAHQRLLKNAKAHSNPPNKS